MRYRAAVFRQFYRGIRGRHGKGDDRQFDKGNIDRLIFGAHGHLAGGGLIALFGDGVGVVRRGFYGEYAIAAGDGFAFLIFQSDRRVRLVRRYGQRVQRGNGEVFELHRIMASIRIGMLKFKRHSVACCHVYTEAFPRTAAVRSKQCRRSFFYREAIITV